MLATYLKASQTSKATAAFTAGYKNTVGGTTISFTSVAFGAENSTRRIYVVVLARAASFRTVSSVTIGGVSATLFLNNPSTSLGPFAVFGADVPTGTSGTVNVTFSGLVDTTVISVYQVLNQSTAINSVVVGSSATTIFSVTSVSRTIDTSALGFVLVGLNLSTARSLTTTNWTVDYETGTTQLQTGLGVSSGSSTTYSASWTSTANTGVFAVSFRN